MPSLSDKDRIAHLEAQLEKMRGLLPAFAPLVRFSSSEAFVQVRTADIANARKALDELTAILQPVSDEAGSA